MVKVARGVFNFLFIVIIIVLSGYFILRAFHKVEIYHVRTGSMEDKIHAGDYILIYKKDHYQIGDVVTFDVGDGFITHRIIRKDGENVVTKGDANNIEDNEIKESAIVGKVLFSGGLLNFIINYKYVLAGFFLSIYLITCYIGDQKQNSEE